MEVVRSIYYWLVGLLYEGSQFAAFLVNPIITLGSVNFSLLTLLTFGGLTAFLSIAIVKWLLL